MPVVQLSNKGADGTVLGQASDKLGFYGLAVPIVKPTVITATDAASAITGAASVATALIALGLCQ